TMGAMFLLILLNAVFPAHKYVLAQSGIVCDPGDGKVTYETDTYYGFTINRAEKTYPNFPLIVTQDPKHTGVNIVVEVQSYPGTVSYEVETRKCMAYDGPQEGMELCSPYYLSGKYYYEKITCEPHTETVYRYIDGTSLKVWLEPTQRTNEWLGWTTETLIDGSYPLRYMYPEKWSLGTWTPEGFTTEGGLGLWTEEEIEKFLEEHPGYNFLKADPRHNEIPTMFLPLAQDPMPSSEGKRVIPLFGDDFTVWGGQGVLYGGDRCMITGGGPDGNAYCAKTVNDTDDPMFGSVDLEAKNITRLRVSFSHIPMDIPGEWHIAVRVSVRQAVFNGGRKETIDDFDVLTQMPGRKYKYNEPEHTFVTYMWISTPCNPAEVNGCRN
ncbi:MAG: hypothetical protein ACK2UB_04830, partial [Anaerolineales bacterium]